MSDPRRASLPAVPDPSLPATPTQDTPSPLDRAAVTTTFQVLTAVVAILGTCAAGLGFLEALVVAFCVVGGLQIRNWWALQRYFRNRQYHRALFLAASMERGLSTAQQRNICRMNRVACYIMLGDHELAKETMHLVERDSLAPKVRAIVDINMAVLYVRMMAPESAHLVLNGVDLGVLRQEHRVYYHLARAAAHALTENFGQAIEEIEKAEALNPPVEIAAACLSFRAIEKLEEKADVAAGLALSNQAMAKLEAQKVMPPGILVTHARVLLESSNDPERCLDVLSRVLGQETELGLSGQAEFHYLHARCFQLYGLPSYARPHLELASELPCTPRLARRIAMLAQELANAGDELDPAPPADPAE